MIETWGFYLFGWHGLGGEPTPEVLQAIHDEYMDLWVKCDEWGFDGLTFAEHHFNPINLSPSPNLLVAAVAARTKNVKFTTLGAVIAMNDARRYAEECGMLQYLTNGRFEPGIAPGSGVFEMVRAGIPAEQVRPRYYSGAELLRKALDGPVTHHDEFYDLENVPLEPLLHLRPDQSVWVTVMQPDSAAWCAERGFKMCTAWNPTPIAATLASRYYETADAAGIKVDPSMVGIRRRVFVADSDAQAQELVEESQDIIKLTAGRAFETVDLNVLQWMLDPDDYSIGSVDTVAERLIEQCRAGGFGVVQAFTDFAGFTPEVLTRSHELIGTKLAPILRSATVDPGARQSDVDIEEYKKNRKLWLDTVNKVNS